MNIDTSDWVWLNDREVCSAAYLAEASGLSGEEIDELVEMGVIVPADTAAGTPAQSLSFHLRCVVTVKAARRLRDDFELDRNGMVLALTLLQRIDALQDELGELRARIAPPH
ncbi:MAG TPA: chaperone modulator CbpM [Herbaspirillum sp.]|jgi:chaperone modulatory protein CbpM